MKFPIDTPLAIRREVEDIELSAFEIASSLHSLIKLIELFPDVQLNGSLKLARERLHKYAKLEADFAEFHAEYREGN